MRKTNLYFAYGFYLLKHVQIQCRLKAIEPEEHFQISFLFLQPFLSSSDFMLIRNHGDVRHHSLISDQTPRCTLMFLIVPFKLHSCALRSTLIGTLPVRVSIPDLTFQSCLCLIALLTVHLLTVQDPSVRSAFPGVNE